MPGIAVFTSVARVKNLSIWYQSKLHKYLCNDWSPKMMYLVASMYHWLCSHLCIVRSSYLIKNHKWWFRLMHLAFKCPVDGKVHTMTLNPVRVICCTRFLWSFCHFNWMQAVKQILEKAVKRPCTHINGNTFTFQRSSMHDELHKSLQEAAMLVCEQKQANSPATDNGDVCSINELTSLPSWIWPWNNVKLDIQVSTLRSIICVNTWPNKMVKNIH